MARKEWEDMVDKEILFDGPDPLGAYMERDDVVALLARQHAAFVRDTKALQKRAQFLKPILNSQWRSGYQAACIDILAALGKRKGGR